MGDSPSLPVSPPRATDYTRLGAEVENAAARAEDLRYSVDDAIEAVGLGRFQYGLLALTGLCWTAESMEMLLLSFIKAPLQCLWNISDARAALITTSVGVGMLLGSASWGLLGDTYGRRTAFVASTAVTFVFGLISALSVNYPMILISRGIVGFGIGGVPIAFSLLMEFLPAANRGTWGMGLALFWSLGAIFESLVALLVVPKLGWRWLIAISTIPLGLVLALSFWVTESPRWLISKGSVEKAQEAIQKVSYVNHRPLPPGQLTLNQDNATEDAPGHRAGGSNHFAKLFQPGARSLALKLWFLWFVCAFVYYGLVMLQPEVISKENTGKRCTYAANECKALQSETTCNANSICSWKNASGNEDTCRPKGLLESESSACARQLTRSDFMSTLWASAGELPGVLVSFAVIDYIGRRPLLGYMFGITAMTFVVLLRCIGRMAETITFFVGRAGSTGAFQGVYLFTNEIYPSSIRTSAMGFSSSIARVGLIASPFVAQYLDNVNHFAAMWLYFGITALAVVVVLLIPIETTRRSLLSSMEELVEILRAGRKEPDDAADEPTFARDPAVHRFIRFFRWNARVDGGLAM